MTDLPKIGLENPVVLPASSERVLNQAFVDRFEFFASLTAPWLAKYRWFAHDGKGNQGGFNEKRIPDVAKVAADRAKAGKPALANALAAVALAFNELILEETAPVPKAPAAEAPAAEAPADAPAPA